MDVELYITQGCMLHMKCFLTQTRSHLWNRQRWIWQDKVKEENKSQDSMYKNNAEPTCSFCHQSYPSQQKDCILIARSKVASIQQSNMWVSHKVPRKIRACFSEALPLSPFQFNRDTLVQSSPGFTTHLQPETTNTNRNDSVCFSKLKTAQTNDS